MSTQKSKSKQTRPKPINAKSYIRVMCWASAVVIGSVAAAFIPETNISAYGAVCENHKNSLKPILNLLDTQPKESVILWIKPGHKTVGYVPGLVMSDGSVIVTGACENEAPLMWETKDTRFVKMFATGMRKNF